MIRRRPFLTGALALPLAACRARAGSQPALVEVPDTLRVMTLNLAHGRGRALTQSQLRTVSYFETNLDTIARVLQREKPAVVALQEAELGSRWAGGFDHVRYLSERSGLPHLHATPHMNEPPRFRYGTALLSRYPLDRPAGGTFSVGGRWNKGWTEASVQTSVGRVRVVSVHLDFASERRRAQQVEELTAALRQVDEPLVVMGDMNSTWSDADRSAVILLATALDLRTWSTDRSEAPTFGRRRIDWIMVTPPIELAQRQVLTGDRLSDHRGVVVDLFVSGRNPLLEV